MHCYLLKRLIVLYLMLSDVNSANHLESLMSENMHLFPEEGVYMEASGITLAFSTFLYQPIHYLIPDNIPFDYMLPSCNEADTEVIKFQLHTMYQDALDKIRSRVDEYESALLRTNDRSKREVILLSLMVAAGVISLMVGMYNTYQITKLNEVSEAMITNINKLEDAAKQTVSKVNELVSSVDNIGSVIIPEIKAKVNTLIYDRNCATEKMSLLFNINRHITEDIVLRAINGINVMYQGKITPDFFPLSDVKKYILSRPDMKSSIYNDDTAMIYQLGKVIPYRISHKPFVVSGMLILPRLLREHVGYTMVVHKVPIIRQGIQSVQILNEPDLLVKDKLSKKFWAPNFDHCLRIMTAYVCPVHETHSKYSSCMTGLTFYNDRSNCTFIKSTEESLIKQSTMGILISNIIPYYHKIHLDADNNRKSNKITLQNNTVTFITAKEAPEVMVNDQIYLLAPETVNFSYPATHLNITGDIITPLILPDAAEVNKIRPDLDFVTMSSHIHQLSSIICFFIIIICLIFLFIAYRKLHNKHTVFIREYQAQGYHMMSKSNKRANHIA